MLSLPRNRAQQLIYQKRANDEKLSNLQTKLKQDFHQKQFAIWQNKGKNLQFVNQVKSQLEQMRQQSHLNLMQRRVQLAQLFQNDAKQYQLEIIASQETPEQIRQRMAQRVKQLKQEKQQRRKNEVNYKLQKRFQQNADELRKVDQDLKQLKTAYQRNIQMVERQNKLHQQYQEEMLFAELNKRDQKKKDQIQKLKFLEQKDKIQQRNAILAVQKQLRQRKIQEEEILAHRQKEMLRQEWERQTQLEKMKERHALQKVKQINKNLYQENQRQKRMKQEQLRLEKQRDKEMIQRIVQKERQLAQYQKWMKQQQRQQAKRVLKGVKSKNQQMAAYEKELDRLIQIQRLKNQKKQEEEWAKRQKARVNLLYQVYNDRERKVRDHQAERQQQRVIREKQKVQINTKTKEYELEQKRKIQEEFLKNKREQEKLLEEIAVKEERRRLLLMELQKEQQEIEQGRQQYNKKIQERKEKGKQQLQVFKQTNRLY